MKIPLHDILQAYEKIISEVNVGEVSVLMFTALDVDALCTLKTLSKLMKSENIEYMIHPVSTYTELEQRIEDCRSFEKVKLFFFINCGGLIDLTAKWFSKQAQVFLFDVHKPIHHANLAEGNNVRVIDDECSGFEGAPTNEEMDIYQNIDEEFMEEIEERDLERRNLEESDDEEGIAAHKRRRMRSAEEQREKVDRVRKIRSAITSKVQQYYSLQFFSLPSSYVAYRMIKDLNKSNNEYLWHAIVGLTGSYLEQKVPKEQFEAVCELYRSDMSKFNPHVKEGKGHAEKNSLRMKLDFQFPVLRHWSLYDSILNSTYMISKLGLWDDQGLSKMHEFLNRLGLSLAESKQLYKFMLADSVKKLEDNIFEVAASERFNLLDITFGSFAKQVDYCVEFMASDYYYALTAALEAPLKMGALEDQLGHRVNCFWEAYSLLEGGQTALGKAIEKYQRTSSIMTREARNILERSHIMNGPTFSFVNFPSDTQDRKLFEHPFTLIKFAHMLMQMNKEKRRMKYYKPFIASLQNNEAGTSLLVGVMSDPKNSFSSKFNFAVEKLNVDVRIDSFMGNIMIVPKDAVVKIIRELGEM